MATVFVLFGPAGSGKTTIASSLSQAFSSTFIEGDTLHSKENVEKMKNGVPLTDDDRSQWLLSLREAFMKQVAKNALNVKNLVFVTCSALKLKYRTVLRDIGKSEITVIFIYLQASREILFQRLTTRKGHFMSASMLDSQLETLEEPKGDEVNVWIVDANQTLETVISQLKHRVNDYILSTT